jgi:hypothetical protein
MKMDDHGGSPMSQKKKKGSVRIKISDETLLGRYANQMAVSHTKEEFILDFMNILPPEGVVNSRVIISPGHMKRILKALTHNLNMYEQKYGPVEEASEPKSPEESDIH